MMCRVSMLWIFLTLILPFVAARWSRRHQEVAHRARGDVGIYKRQSYSNARFTFYDVGLGACGEWSGPNDWIVALNVEQYGSGYPGPLCFQSITIEYGGKTAQATIVDECMGCPWGGLDFSRGLFSYFASMDEGVLYGNWWFNGGSGDQSSTTWAPPSTTWEPPTTTSTPDYTPPAPTSSSTPDYTPAPTSSSTPDYTPPTLTTSSTPAYTPPLTTSLTSSTSGDFSTGWASKTALPTALAPPSNLEIIAGINKILIDVGIMLSLAVKSE